MIQNGQLFRQPIIDELEEKICSVANKIVALLDNGYVINKDTVNIINWYGILIDGYENVMILTKEQHDNLDRIYNKVLSL